METVGRNDRILIAVVLGIALIAGLWMFFIQKPVSDGVVTVTVDGEVYGSYPLAEDRVETIRLPDGAYNVLEISDGKADITEASCPDGVCVAHRRISRTNQTIVCLPNQLIVTIDKAGEPEVDFVTK